MTDNDDDVELLDASVARNILALLVYRAGGKITVTRAEYEELCRNLGDTVPFVTTLAPDHNSFSLEIAPHAEMAPQERRDNQPN